MPSTDSGSKDKDLPGFVSPRRSQRSLRAPPCDQPWLHPTNRTARCAAHSDRLSLATQYQGATVKTPTPLPDPPVLYRPADAGRLLNLSRSTIFELMRTRRLRSVKEGRVRLIPASAIRDYVSLLESEAA